MPKQKKPARNAYYYFMMDKKKQFEVEGYRFPGGMKDIAAMEDVRQEWKDLDSSRKSKYEKLAKEAKQTDKVDLSNKFTCSGESYAHVGERQRQAELDAELLGSLLEAVTQQDNYLNGRTFVILKSTHTCEVNHPISSFWPVEFAMASFKLDTGLLSKWWTLVNTVQAPTGYASAAKDTFERTALPYPGSSVFKPPHGDYVKILNNVKNFVSFFVKDYNGYYPVFVMQNEEACTEGCLRWLHENADYETARSQREMEEFLSQLKFIRVSKLLLKLAAAARMRDSSYNAPIAMFDYLEDAAIRVLSKGDYNYKENITCSFHNVEENSAKMHECCLNIILRTIFIIFGELLHPLRIEEPTTSHFINCVSPPTPYGVQERAPEPQPTSGNQSTSRLLSDAWESEPTRKVAKTDDAEGFANYPTLGNSVAGSTFGSAGMGSERTEALRNAWDTPRKQESTPATFTNEDFPSLENESGFGGGRGRSPRGLDDTPNTFVNTAPSGGGRGRGRGGVARMPDFIRFPEQESQSHSYQRGEQGRGTGFH